MRKKQRRGKPGGAAAAEAVKRKWNSRAEQHSNWDGVVVVREVMATYTMAEGCCADGTDSLGMANWPNGSV